MRLHVHRNGTGDRTALLVHGAIADHRTWHAVEDALVRRGYRVLAPDLRGHGRSPRGPYTPELMADDLAENLPAGPDLAIGHSLGGLALSLAVERLRPRRAVYHDPAWRFANVTPGAHDAMRAMVRDATPETIRAMNPRWSDADVDAEMAGFGLVDPAVLDMMREVSGRDHLPAGPAVPSLVQLADPSLTIDAAAAAVLRERGFEVRVVTGAGHCCHRDDLDGYLATLEGWL